MYTALKCLEEGWGINVISHQMCGKCTCWFAVTPDSFTHAGQMASAEAGQSKTEAEKEKIVQKWKELWEFLEEQKQLLMRFLEGLAQEKVYLIQRSKESPSGSSAEIDLPSEKGGEKGLQVLIQSLQETATFQEPEDGDGELEWRLRHFSESWTVLQEMLSSFQGSLQLQVQNLTETRMAASDCTRTVPPPKQRRTETDMAKLVQWPTAFEDVAIDFTEDEWAHLEAPQRALYRDVMQENYENVTSLILTIMKPEMISQLEETEEPGMKGLRRTKRQNQGRPIPSAYSTTRIKPYKCSDCWKGFRSRPQLAKHAMIHRGEKPYKCPDCGKNFSSRSNLLSHQKVHVKEKPYKCSDCGKSFRSEPELARHETVHTGETPYKCAECGKSFSAQSNLRSHQKIHVEEKPYKCYDCGKELRSRQQLTHHEMIHTGEKPYKCADCGKSFRHRSNIVEHQKTHTGEKPYKCHICGKGYSQKTHLFVHVKDKPYPCPDCGKTFRSSKCLHAHQKTHTGVKPYKCVLCGESFYSRLFFVQHHQMTHVDPLNPNTGILVNSATKPVATPPLKS
ncbi:zinc finger protein 558-like isoform X2 [Hemicordylus capensis]|uniref:zinc finger protein 558-like isoform X2 n=1 Tax=Hemicordylus capensis TaxID=884348 RepID=UPI0023030E79|nr:zinc finger protein 558-like isoform X2 [Hemicordylus capensis]